MAMLAASRAAFARSDASQSVRRALNRRVPGDPGRVHAPRWVVRYWLESKSSTRRGMHGSATAVSHTGLVVRLLHGSEHVTRNASDVEHFDAADPAQSHASDTGVVGAALSALRNASLPSSPVPPSVAATAATTALLEATAPQLDVVAALVMVALGMSAVDCRANLPAELLADGAAHFAAMEEGPAWEPGASGCPGRGRSTG